MKKPGNASGKKTSHIESETVKNGIREGRQVLESLRTELEFVKVKYEALHKINESQKNEIDLYKLLNEALQRNNEVLQKVYESLQAKYDLLQKEFEYLQQSNESVKSNNEAVKRNIEHVHLNNEAVQQNNEVIHQRKEAVQQINGAEQLRNGVQSVENEVLNAGNASMNHIQEVRKRVHEFISAGLKDNIKQKHLFEPITDMVMLFLEQEHRTGADIRNRMKLSRSTMNRYMQRLTKLGLISYSGSPRWEGRYGLTVKGRELINIMKQN